MLGRDEGVNGIADLKLRSSRREEALSDFGFRISDFGFGNQAFVTSMATNNWRFRPLHRIEWLPAIRREKLLELSSGFLRLRQLLLRRRVFWVARIVRQQQLRL